MSEFRMGIAATTGGTDVFGLVVSGSMFVVSVLATLAFGYALIADRSWLTEAWVRIRRLPLVGGWTRHRDMPAPQGRTFQQLWAEHKAGVPR